MNTAAATQAQTLSRRRLVDDAPQAVAFRDASSSAFRIVPQEAVPSGDARVGPKGVATGCLYDADGRRIDLSQRQGDLVLLDPPQLDAADGSVGAAERWRGRTLYLGQFMNQYGHFLTEFLSRLWILERGAEFDRIAAHPSIFNRGRYLPGRHHSYLAGLLGLRLERLEILRTPVRFAEALVPEQLWSLNRHANTHLRPLYARIADHHRRARSSGRIFLSRGTYPGCRLANAPAVEEVFAGFGFSVLYPQEIDIARQLELYANCEILAGLSGSGLHNALFCRPGTPVIDVGDQRSRRRSTRMQQMADDLAGAQSQFIPYRGGADARTDIALLRADLARLLGERPRPGRVVRLRLSRAVDWLLRPRQVWRRRHRRR